MPTDPAPDQIADTAAYDVRVEWKGYLHVEDGRICYPAPADSALRHRTHWQGDGDAPEPGEWIHRGYHDSRTWPCLREHPEQPSPHPMVAVIPGPHKGGTIVHLMLPGYRPAGSHKSTSRRPTQTMCGQHGANTLHWSGVDGRDEPTGREHWPVSVAANELAQRGYLRWCHACVGRAVEHHGLLNDVVRLVVERDLTPVEHR